MKRFYLTGQRTFGNRGCEAIVRSTVMMLKQTFGDVEVLVPSDDIERDQLQWPEAKMHGLQFVEAYQPMLTRPWAHLQRIPLKMMKSAGWPFPFSTKLCDEINSVDAILSVGGDNYSLDYRLPSLLMGMDRLAMDLGKPVFVWGASVGPFEAEPHFVPSIREHLNKMMFIGARESITYEYLTGMLGLKNVIQMADPAFTLAKEPVDTNPFWPMADDNNVIGLNISPLIERYKKNGQDLRKNTLSFIRTAVGKGFGVLLTPHVIPLDNSTKNNDAVYMAGMLDELRDIGSAVTIMPSKLNASQIKQVISQLRFFIGARTHATIAALSSGIPTLSISYSVKSKGINKDLLGNMPVVLATPELSAQSLTDGLDYLIKNEILIRSILKTRLPEWKKRVKEAANEIKVRI